MKDFIEQVKELLQNSEWIKRFDNYADAILDNLSVIEKHKKLFHEWAPLHLYMNITEAKSNMLFSLRYLGQDVAKIKVKNEKVTISTKKFERNNERDFGCSIILDDVEWKSVDASNFRKYFVKNLGRTGNSGKGNEEHRIESLLLTEFSKKIGSNKLIRNIQPVKLGGIARFQMSTPLGASNIKKLKYSNSHGGGIDILSRIGVGKATKLCIMEVKDENNTKETPTKAIQQGLAYAVFIRELLRSESGDKWWQLFGFSGQLPTKLDLYVTCVMPYVENVNNSFANKVLSTKNGDNFHLHYLYFKENNNALENIVTSLKQCK